jgi:bacterial cell division membrane protein
MIRKSYVKKIDNKRVRHLRIAKFMLLLFSILSISLSLIYNVSNVSSNDVKTYFLLIVTITLTTILTEKLMKDNILFLIINMLFSIGVSIVYRLDPSVGKKQLIFYLVGIVLFFITYFILYRFNVWDKLIIFYFAITILLFVFTLIFGTWVGGAKNWIMIGPISIQPSEFIKIPFVFFIASFYSNYDKFVEKYKILGRLIMTIGVYIFIGFFFLQRELGTAIICFGVMIFAQFTFEKDYKLIIVNVILMILGLIFAYKVMSHVQVRFNIWKNPFDDPKGGGYQIVQSLIAISSAGLFGKGIGLGDPDFIPVADSDFIFSSVIEEMGIFTGIAIMLLFLLLIYKGLQIGYKQKNTFYSVLAFSISVMFGIQSLLILGGVTNITPLTGVTLPFLSAGGSSMISGFILLACLQFANRKEVEFEKRNK